MELNMKWGYNSRSKDNPTHLVTLGQHLLLGDEHLLGRDLDAQVTAGNHDAVALLDDGVDVLAALVVLNLADDLDVLAILPWVWRESTR